jgi:hypothetical protein
MALAGGTLALETASTTRAGGTSKSKERKTPVEDAPALRATVSLARHGWEALRRMEEGLCGLRSLELELERRAANARSDCSAGPYRASSSS